jgi:hypothetical protein
MTCKSRADARHEGARPFSSRLHPVMGASEAVVAPKGRIERTLALSTRPPIDINDARKSLAVMVVRESLVRGG